MLLFITNFKTPRERSLQCDAFILSLQYYGVHKKRDALTKIVTAKLPVNEIFKQERVTVTRREAIST
jgi:hypothetical protein